jgi:hypothetical protein
VFAGSILAHTSISMDNGVTVHGRALARIGAVTLINDTIGQSRCTTPTSTAPISTVPTSTAPGSTTPGTTTPGKKRPTKRPTHNGTAVLTTVPRSVVSTIDRHGTSRCVIRTFQISVRGLFIRRVVFSLGGKVIATRRKAPFTATVVVLGGVRLITARVIYSDHTRSARLHLKFRACNAAALKTVQPIAPPAPVGFTG